ncbi:MAG: sigma-70 family RNA polymerase sigma factor [Cyclobacteriaceae bacterium]|nr:sigma-70 family RNA polymerase sigma factor [Cyclobacteriaceae bacterium]
MITLEEENLLLDRILAGDKQAYARLVDRYKNFAFTIAMKVLDNRPEAEEAAQDAFIKAFHYLKNFNRQARFSTWLYRITFNTAISYKRKHKLVFQSVEKTIIPQADLAEQELEQSDKLQFVHQAMQSLNEADRLALQLFYLNELSLEEVAGITAQNVNTVKVRVHRARQRLAEELKRILKQEVITL